MKVLNFGSLNLDYVYSVDHMVAPGETLCSSGMHVFCGGKGLNQSIALAKAGVPVYHAGMIGEEGGILLEACREGGVNADYIRTVSEKCGHTIIQVDKDGFYTAEFRNVPIFSGVASGAGRRISGVLPLMSVRPAHCKVGRPATSRATSTNAPGTGSASLAVETRTVRVP